MFVIQRSLEQGHESVNAYRHGCTYSRPVDDTVVVGALGHSLRAARHARHYAGYPGVQPGTAGVDALRRDPSPLVNLGVRKIFDHLAQTIAALDTKPIIMGHSFGGAFVRLLLDAGYGSAGVSLDGAAVKGVWALPFSEIKATFPVLRNPANLHRAVPITEKEFRYAFTNNLSPDESKRVDDRYAVPVSGRILFQGGFANVAPNAATRYNFANDDRAPRERRKECEALAGDLGV